jgi:hypothetical protein
MVEFHNLLLDYLKQVEQIIIAVVADVLYSVGRTTYYIDMVLWSLCLLYGCSGKSEMVLYYDLMTP